MWLGISLRLAWPLAAEFGGMIGPLPAWFVIIGITLVPGFMNAFQTVSLLLTTLQTTTERVGALKIEDGKPVDDRGYAIEDFGLPCNLMLAVPCKVIEGGLEEGLKELKGNHGRAALADERR